MKGFEEHTTNVLAKEVISNKEMRDFAKGIVSPKIAHKIAQYEQGFAQDPIVTKICKECGKPYSYPVRNTWAHSKLGPDEGLCHECSGAYDDPEGFLKLG